MSIDHLSEKSVPTHRKLAYLPSVLKGSFLSKMAGVMLLTGCHIPTVTPPGLPKGQLLSNEHNVQTNNKITPEDIPALEKDRRLQTKVDRWYGELLSQVEGPYVAFMSKEPSDRTVQESEDFLKILRAGLMNIIREYAKERPEVAHLLSQSPVPAADIVQVLFEQYGYLFSSEARSIAVQNTQMDVIHIDLAEFEVEATMHCEGGTCSFDSVPFPIAEFIGRNMPRIIAYSLDTTIALPSNVTIRATRPRSGIRATSTVTRAGFVSGNPPSLYILYHKFSDELLDNPDVLGERVEDLVAHELSHALHSKHFASIKDGATIPYESSVLPSIVPVHVNEAMAFLHSAMAGGMKGKQMSQHLVWGRSTPEYALAMIVLERFVQDFLRLRKASGIEIPSAFDGFVNGEKTFREAFLDRATQHADKENAQSLVMEELQKITAAPDAEEYRMLVFEKYAKQLQELFARLKKE